MKNLKLLFVAALLLGASSFVNAQSKVAHIDTQALVQAMPEMKSAQAQLDKLEKTYKADLQASAKELEAKIKQYDAEASTKTDEENAKRYAEVQGMQQNIGGFQQQAIEDIDKKRRDLLQPVLEKARAAIQKVARAQGFQYVMDSTTGSGLILADGTDLLASVKKELGI